MADRLSMFNLIYLSYNKTMSMDNSGQTLEQLNAIYEMAMQKANDDKQKMLERFNSVS